MGGSIGLGRWAGIRVGVHWSVLVVFVVIALGLAGGRLPDAHPGRPEWLYWLWGLLAAVVFLASVLAHELAHALVARRHGMGADAITLWLLGGVARMRDEAPSPGAELRVAGVGPLVSLLLGAAFGAAASGLDLAGASPLVVEAVAWLAGINVVLAVFNALPAAPLDGGRMLRALVWWRTGDRLRATATATASGRILGWGLIGWGALLFFVGGGFGGLWLALIGWFMIAAATAESRRARTREALRGLRVRQAMTSAPVTVPASLTAAALLAAPPSGRRHSAFPVTGADGAPVGLVTVDRVLRVPAADRGAVALSEVMLPLDEVATAAPDDALADLLTALEGDPGRRALVLEEGRLVGIVSPSDIDRTLTWLTSSPWTGR
ncbi:site-2 protease family protein [Streptomyces capparidis]